MANEKKMPAGAGRSSNFYIEGQIQREQPECQPGELKLAAYVFDSGGTLLGSGEVDGKGNYRVGFAMAKPADVTLLAGPADTPEQIRASSAFRKSFSAKDWQAEGDKYRIKYETILPLDVWRPWWPLRICVSGHVRKVSSHDGVTSICPVPFVKVEIFDVDREPCYWPYLRKWWELLYDKPVFRIPELLKEPKVKPRPFPGPDPAPDLMLASAAQSMGNARTAGLHSVSLNPQPEPPSFVSGMTADRFKDTWLNPQPEPPMYTFREEAFTRVGESRLMDRSVASRLDKLTLTSKVAPWSIFPRCFYSKVEVCETTTDCKGYFNCCFKWWPFHFRSGRLRYDSRPDIIVKVTQVIDGVTTVIYMDPYTSTRWNVTNAHIDLFLDNEDVVCGSGDCYVPPSGTPVFFTRIGDDEVFKINQASGLYNEVPLSNVAYGGSLLIYGQFGDGLTTGAPMRYYRLSYAVSGSSEFTPITVPLGDTRVAKGAPNGQSHTLGPLTINGTPALYEVRNFSDYYWYNPDWLGTWYSWIAEADTGKYVLRLEVFDENGVKLTTAMGVNYLDGTSALLPAMTDRCDLVMTLDNKAPEVELTIPAVINPCGVIPWTPALSLDFDVHVSQENGRLHSWGLYYTKGINPAENYLASGSSNTGLPGSVNQTVPGGTAAPAPGTGMLQGLSTTCAFALKLWAYAHVRDGRNFIYYTEQMKAVAVEKC
ncbi:MAG: hypothetical protein ACKVP5_07195 [Aestuariivirga sp.]